jgi:hypothetical protein
MSYRIELYEFTWLLEMEHLWTRTLPAIIKTSVENRFQTMLYKFLKHLKSQPITDQLRKEFFGTFFCMIVEKESGNVVGSMTISKMSVVESITIFEEFRRKKIALTVLKHLVDESLSLKLYLTARIDPVEDPTGYTLFQKTGFVIGEDPKYLSNRHMKLDETYENSPSQFGKLIMSLAR